MLLFTKFILISAKNSNAIVCDIFNINVCEILNKTQFLCPKIQYGSLFIIIIWHQYLYCVQYKLMYAILRIFLAEISPTFDKISIFVSMATTEAPWLLGMFQLLILEGYGPTNFLFSLY